MAAKLMVKKTGLIIILMYGFQLSAQVYMGEKFELNTTQNNYQYYTARDYIKLLPNFRGIPGIGKEQSYKINNDLVFIQDYVIGAQIPFSTALPVGTLPGSVDVSPTGAATYSIPIALSPGTAGVMPGLSIVYNSQSGDGMLGHGWTIGGFSAISRVPADMYHDGMIDAVDFDENDRLALDGQRLIMTEGTLYGTNGTKYHTENESYLSINASGEGLVTPAYFTVTTKDGKTMEYGGTDNSRIEVPGRTTVLLWLLNKVTDEFGNSYSIEYTEIAGQFFPKEIRYTKNEITGIDSYNSIHFYYTVKQDQHSIFIGGAEINNTQLLHEIKIFNEGFLVRKYGFNYSYDNYSKLSEIVLQEDKETKINTTKINWGSASQIPWMEYDLNFESEVLTPGDYNGDGKTDFACLKYKRDGDNNIVKDAYGKPVCTSLDIYTAQNNNGTYLNVYTEAIADKPVELLPGDFNGDGRQDLLYLEYNNAMLSFHLLNSSATGYNHQYFVTNCLTNNDVKFEIGDFNGDSKQDWMIKHERTALCGIIFPTVISGTNAINIYSYNNTDNPMLIAEKDFGTDFFNQKIVGEVSTLDFNGNGKTDFMFVQSDCYINSTAVLELNQSNTFDYLLYESSSYDTEYKGDFNGDGKTDLLVYTNNAWKLYYSTGTGFVEGNAPQSETTNYDKNMFYVSDFDGNGLADVVEYKLKEDGSFGYVISIFYKHASGFEEKWITNLYFNTFITKPFYMSYSPYIDINGDGQQDFLYNAHNGKKSGNNQNSVAVYFPNEQKHLVQSIIDGMNNTSYISYLPLTNPGVYSKGNGAVFPVADIQPALYAVSQISSPNGIGGQSTLKFSYADAKLHVQGKGFLGYMTTFVEDISRDILTENNNNYSLSNFSAYPVSSIVSFTGILPKDDEGKISETIFTQNFYTNPDHSQIIFPYTEKTVQFDYLRNTKIQTDYLYDFACGKPNHSTTEFYNGTETNAILEGEAVANIEYNNAGKPTQIISTKIKGAEQFQQTSKNTYDPGKGFLTQTISNFGTDKQVTTNYGEYDNFGLFHTQTISESGFGMSLTTRYDYDPKGRFITKKTDPLGNFAEYVYNTENGTVLKSTDNTGLTSTTEYDAFGKAVSSTSAIGTQATDRVYFAGTNPYNARTYRISSASGSPDIKTWYDMLGRERAVETVDFNGQTVIVTKEYNALGQLWKVSEPHTSGSSLNETVYSYDEYGRILQISSLIGTTSYSYNGRSTSISYPDGTSISETRNSLGQTTLRTDAGGTISNTYFASGLPKTVTAPGNYTVTFEYDAVGNRTKIIDPDGGIVQTSFDAFGNVRTETTPSGSTTFNYDNIGRLNNRISPDGTNTYAYVPTGTNGSGQVAAVSHSSGASQTYAYDRYGRMTANTESFEGIGYTYTNTYDNLGRIAAVNYPSGIGYRNIFDERGFLKQISDETGVMLWQLNQTNVMGQITSVTAGNGKTTVRGYDAYHFPQSVVTGSLQNNTYSFRKENGNLLSRTDNIFGLSESFSYDAADRLEKNTFNATELVTAYDVSGNITAKTDAGASYLYNSTKPHAVTGINNATTNIPVLQQNITYTSFDKVQKITEGSHTLNFAYGIDRQRRKTVLKNGSEILKTKYFFGNYEKEITPAGTRELNTIPGFDGNYALIVKDNNEQRNIYYIYTDHLGSTNIVSDASGNAVERHNFDAWGRERNAVNWSVGTGRDLSLRITDRGYTGHEMLPEFGIINMNGRLYDPVLGRMLSPDPYVQAPGNSQNYNRYSYVLNNPMKYSDPSGEFIWAPVIIGAIIGAAYGSWKAEQRGQEWYQGAWKGAIVGAAAGALGQYGGGLFWENVAWGAGQGAFTGGLDAALWGDNVGQGMAYGAATGAVFAGIGSGFEAYGNYQDGYGFYTDERVYSDLDNSTGGLYVNTDGTIGGDVEGAQNAMDYWSQKNTKENVKYILGTENYPNTETGVLTIDYKMFSHGHQELKNALSHEYGHYINDIAWVNEVGGQIAEGEHMQVAPFYGDPLKGYDGLNGYHYVIRNSGKYHIPYRVVSGGTYGKYMGTAWTDYNSFYSWYSWIGKYYYLLPQRF